MLKAGLAGNYAQTAEAVLQCFTAVLPACVVRPNVEELSVLDTRQALSAILESCNGDAILAPTLTADAAADLLIRRLHDLASLAGSKLSEREPVAIVGGWSQNKAFLELLWRKGINVVVPLHASEATTVGVAAKTLFEAMEIKMDEVLSRMPQFRC
ncbi:MAG: hypothetical protein IT292_04100 [Deltaproteobacteria bacterium]|nr:hypothetical protein [Deltaproteobacteria bacterium]